MHKLFLLDIESEKFDSKLSYKLKIQAEEYHERKLARIQKESQTSKEDGRI